LNKVDQEAIDLLQSIGLTKPPVDVYRMANELNVEILLEKLDDEVSGVLLRLPERLVIAVNKNHSEARQRFTIAHELGHLRLHQGRPLIVDHIVRARVSMRDSQSSLATEREEIDANRFAANLLMPEDLVHEAVVEVIEKKQSEKQTIKVLAQQFGVSDKAMEYRLTNLGLRSAM
jgi:Zn-dependent peptidase ImmA (M78 family)